MKTRVLQIVILTHSERTGDKSTDAGFVSTPERKGGLGVYKLFNTEFNSSLLGKLRF